MRERSLTARLTTLRGAAARDFDCGQGGEAGASPQRAVRAEPTQATGKRPAARRVFGQRVVWLRCSSVEDPQGIFSLVAPRHTTLCPKTAPLIVFKRAVKRQRVFIVFTQPPRILRLDKRGTRVYSGHCEKALVRVCRARAGRQRRSSSIRPVYNRFGAQVQSSGLDRVWRPSR